MRAGSTSVPRQDPGRRNPSRQSLAAPGDTDDQVRHDHEHEDGEIDLPELEVCWSPDRAGAPTGKTRMSGGPPIRLWPSGRARAAAAMLTADQCGQRHQVDGVPDQLAGVGGEVLRSARRRTAASGGYVEREPVPTGRQHRRIEARSQHVLAAPSGRPGSPLQRRAPTTRGSRRAAALSRTRASTACAAGLRRSGFCSGPGVEAPDQRPNRARVEPLPPSPVPTV